VDNLTERKVVRRGMIAALASLGAAALIKVSGAEKASATDGDAFLLGNMASGGVGAQTSTADTRLHVTGANGLQIIKDGGGGFVGAVAAVIGSDGSGGGVGVMARETGALASGFAVNAASANGTGVSSTTHNAASFAVDGRGQNNATGVRGESRSAASPSSIGSGAGTGVQGLSNTGRGVQGVSSTLFGVEGQATNAAGFGVRGVNSQNGTGIKGVSNTGGNTANDGTGNGVGVQGKSTGGPGVEGVSVNSLGVRGTSTNFVGVVGISTNNHGLYGFTSSPSGVALVGDNGGGGLAGVFNGRVEVYGSFQVFGVKNAVLKMPDGTNALVYCQESPEPYFEDFGRAQLVGGVANVPIERDFAGLVAGGDYRVTVTPEGLSNHLFVSRRTPTGFEVREGNNGVSNVSFTYRIVTKRKDVEGKRFARVGDDGIKSVAASRAALGVSGTPPANVPGTPNPVNPPTVNPVAPGPTNNAGPFRDGPR
jgi:hypothetical protein